MKFKESTRKYILLGIVTLIVIGIIVAKVMAKSQDEQFATEDILYQKAQQLYTDGNYSEAATYINEVLKNQPNSEAVNYLGGIIAANNGEMKQAAILLQKTIEINPHRVEDAMFMLQLGEIFYSAERYNDAKTVLTRCQQAGWAPEKFPNYQQKVTELLTSIENM